MSCKCISSSRPSWGGTILPVEMVAPGESYKVIHVDECAVPVLEALWAAGVGTRGICCGHNRHTPSVVIEDAEDAGLARQVIEAVDGRQWKIMCWVLAKVAGTEGAGVA